VWGLAARDPLRVDILRDRSTLGQEIEGELIENVYQLQIMNMTEVPRSFSLAVSGLPGLRLQGAERVEVAPAATQSITVRVHVPYDEGKPGANTIFFDVAAEDDPALALKEETTFLIPR
jgi:polyferredoxin